jgi:hypothetical protein
MSVKHPIIAITGSSGAGTTSVTRTFENIFRREKVTAAIIEGDSFHRFDRLEMRKRAAEAEKQGNNNFSLEIVLGINRLLFRNCSIVLNRAVFYWDPYGFYLCFINPTSQGWICTIRWCLGARYLAVPFFYIPILGFLKNLQNI